MVSADVILRPRERSDFRAAASRASNAAARALDSIYRTAAGSTRDEGDLALRFATVCVDQLGCRSSLKNDRPLKEGGPSGNERRTERRAAGVEVGTQRSESARVAGTMHRHQAVPVERSSP